jgi:ATP-binding cassette subfamily B protein
MRRARGAVSVNDLTFSYDGSRPVLRNVSFQAEPGQVVALLGPPGSGKSTIVSLIPRFYDVPPGSITIDGVDIRDMTLASLRRNIGLVQQDVFLFSASIRDNIAYGRADATMEEIVRAAKVAQLHDFIEGLDQGYDTIIGERGSTLSGGQRQRLSIARSVMLRPPIMIFDDSTAAIDAGTEQRIRASLREVTRQCATIIVAHRLSSLMHAAEILFLDHGRVVERGSHEELLAQGGRYAALYELQARRPSDGAAAGPEAEAPAGAESPAANGSPTAAEVRTAGTAPAPAAATAATANGAGAGAHS